jgi:hypothetical protein
MESSCEDDYFYDSEYDSQDDDEELARKIFGGDGKQVKIYCAICAGKHSEENCPNKHFLKSIALNSVRTNFEKANKY